MKPYVVVIWQLDTVLGRLHHLQPHLPPLGFGLKAGVLDGRAVVINAQAHLKQRVGVSDAPQTVARPNCAGPRCLPFVAGEQRERFRCSRRPRPAPSGDEHRQMSAGPRDTARCGDEGRCEGHLSCTTDENTQPALWSALGNDTSVAEASPGSAVYR